MNVSAGNEGQAAFWSEFGGEAWVTFQDQMDRQLGDVGNFGLSSLNAKPGESVLDVGCGCGATTLDLAATVGPSGRVVGLDISIPMTELAAKRLFALGLDQASALVGDAQVATITELGGRFDAVFSRFGVMFFSDPIAAFTNLRTLTKFNGRLAFVCWQDASKNPVFSDLGRELAAIVPSSGALVSNASGPGSLLGPVVLSSDRVAGSGAPDPLAPGPLAFADPDRIRSVLGDSGWSNVEITGLVAPMQLFGTTDFELALEGSLRIGGAARMLRGADEETVVNVREAATRVLKSQWTEQGAVVESATWIVTATNNAD